MLKLFKDKKQVAIFIFNFISLLFIGLYLFNKFKYQLLCYDDIINF